MMFSAEQLKVISSCFAYSEQRRNSLKPTKRLAYYTTAETALQIIENGTFWLRNPRLMNDFAEVVHGTQCLDYALKSPAVVQRATTSIGSVYPGLFEELLEHWQNRRDTYPFVACLSEIDRDDSRGRLSMWRAYGGNNGIALVMKDELLDLDSNFINTFHSPILYGDSKSVTSEIAAIFDRLGAIPIELQAVGREFVRDRLLNALQFAMVSIKHEGFREEQEWRLVHHFQSDDSTYLKYRTAIVRGNAEVLCELNLNSHAFLHPSSIIEKVIVGPCAFPDNAKDAITLAFRRIGGPVPKIELSDIPLRHG